MMHSFKNKAGSFATSISIENMLQVDYLQEDNKINIIYYEVDPESNRRVTSTVDTSDIDAQQINQFFMRIASI